MRNPILIFCLIGGVLSSSSKIGTSLNKILHTAETTNIFVTFENQNEQLYQTLNTQSFSNRGQKINYLATTLETQAHTTQQNVINFLSTHQIEYKSFWISNKIFISNANKSLIDSLANFPEIVSIREEIVIKLEAAIETSSDIQQSAQSWGIQKIQATNAWNITRGEGVVVANIDSGVLYTHEALQSNFRSIYGWYDPYDNTSTPNDQHGHGTHVMGTIAGRNGIGVAPESTWIACKGCSVWGCSEHTLLDCGQWILCPTTADGSQRNCSMAPHVVCNSWGSNEGNDSWYDDTIKAWVQAGIIPVFAIGNAGTRCRTVGSPGDRSGVIGVGSTDSNDRISYFSSVGPTADNRTKPDIVAPGSGIRSASHSANTLYAVKSGTSMAAPHVAGTIALILSKTKGLSFEEVRDILKATVHTNLTSQNATCGNITDSTFPNNHFGYGRLNAFEALKAAPTPMPTIGTTFGTTLFPDGTSTSTLGTTTAAIQTTTTLGTTAAVHTTTSLGTTAAVQTTTTSETTTAFQTTTTSGTPAANQTTTTTGTTTTAVQTTTNSGTTTAQSAKQGILTILCFFVVNIFLKPFSVA